MIFRFGFGLSAHLKLKFQLCGPKTFEGLVLNILKDSLDL